MTVTAVSHGYLLRSTFTIVFKSRNTTQDLTMFPKSLQLGIISRA